MTATLNIADFRAAFPEFADATVYPDTAIRLRWTQATTMVSPISASGDPLGDDRRQLILYLLTAHFLSLSTQIASGEYPAYTVAGSTSKISVTTLTPPAQDTLIWWFYSTAYGAQIAAMLRQAVAPGLLFGGSGAQLAYRAPFQDVFVGGDSAVPLTPITPGG